MSFDVLGPRGLPMVNLAGERSWKQFTKGDMVASLQWIDVQAFDPHFEHEGPQPCMCLFASHKRTIEQSAYVIPQANAFKYAKSNGTGFPPAFLMAVRNALIEMGFDANDKHAAHRLLDLVVECMPELIAMPSEQPKDLHVARQIAGIEVAVKVNGKTVHQDVV
jgi:hypothetical protein